jgi:hypothetical protein
MFSMRSFLTSCLALCRFPCLLFYLAFQWFLACLHAWLSTGFLSASCLVSSRVSFLTSFLAVLSTVLRFLAYLLALSLQVSTIYVHVASTTVYSALWRPLFWLPARLSKGFLPDFLPSFLKVSCLTSCHGFLKVSCLTVCHANRCTKPVCFLTASS